MIPSPLDRGWHLALAEPIIRSSTLRQLRAYFWRFVGRCRLYLLLLPRERPLSERAERLGGIHVQPPGRDYLGPSVTYYFNVGPDFDDFERGTGAVETASSYLIARVDSTIPIYKDIVSLAPWFAFGTSFDYNARVRTTTAVSSFSPAPTTSRSASGCRSRSMR